MTGKFYKSKNNYLTTRDEQKLCSLVETFARHFVFYLFKIIHYENDANMEIFRVVD